MLEGGEKAFAAADAETEQDRSRKEQGWSTPKLPRWSSLVPEGQKVEGKGSEPPVLRLFSRTKPRYTVKRLEPSW